MPTEAGSNLDLAYSDMQTLVTALSTHDSSLAAYIYTGSGSPPVFQDLVGNVTLNNLVNIAIKAKDSLNGLALGTVTKSLYSAAAIIREASMVLPTKSQLYQAASIDISSNPGQLSEELGSDFNYLRGTTLTQNSLV